MSGRYRALLQQVTARANPGRANLDSLPFAVDSTNGECRALDGAVCVR